MKAILSAAVALGLCGLCGLAWAADDKKAADPVGTWKLEYTIGDMKRSADLTVTKDGDKLAATVSWPDQKDVKVKDLKFKDGELTFSAVRKFMDNEIPLDYKLKVEGDKLTGKGSAEFGGNKQEFDITRTRGKMEAKKDK